MHPLTFVVAGFVMALFDFRVDGFDLAPDTVGWLVAAWGLHRLAGFSRWFSIAGASAGMGAILGIFTLLSEPSRLLSALSTSVEITFVVLSCSGVVDAADSDPGVRATASRIRWFATGGVTAAYFLLSGPNPGGNSPAPGWVYTSGGLAVALSLVTLGIAAWFLLFLLSLRRRPPFHAANAVDD